MKKIHLPLIISFSFAFLILGCTARKVELQKNEQKQQVIEKLQAQSFDYSKLIQANFSTNTGVIFVKEYFNNGNVKIERVEQKNEVNTAYKTETKKRYLTFNVYKKYKITETTKIKETQKEQMSNWVFYFALFLIFSFGLIIYYFPKKDSILF